MSTFNIRSYFRQTPASPHTERPAKVVCPPGCVAERLVGSTIGQPILGLFSRPGRRRSGPGLIASSVSVIGMITGAVLMKLMLGTSTSTVKWLPTVAAIVVEVHPMRPGSSSRGEAQLTPDQAGPVVPPPTSSTSPTRGVNDRQPDRRARHRCGLNERHHPDRRRRVPEFEPGPPCSSPRWMPQTTVEMAASNGWNSLILMPAYRSLMT